MAGLTIDGGVPAFQRKKSSMVEITQAVDAVMAFQAGRPKLGRMIFHEDRGFGRMATDTCTQVCGVQVIPVTALTGYGFPGEVDRVAGQTEGCLDRMLERLPIQVGRFPGLRGMTGGAILVECAFMDGRFGMASLAIFGCVLEPGISMAPTTAHPGVLPFEGEFRTAMIEAGHPILTIVTCHAIPAEVFQVLDHEFKAMVRVAFLARTY
jgi:hypothetical protein